MTRKAHQTNRISDKAYLHRDKTYTRRISGQMGVRELGRRFRKWTFTGLSPPPEHLGEDAADAPQVHRRGVAGLEQHLWGSVPQRHHLERTNISSTRKEPYIQSPTSCAVDITHMKITHMYTHTHTGLMLLCPHPVLM